MPDEDSHEIYPYSRAWNYVLWLLGRRAYTRAQLAEKLTKKGALPEVVDRVIARLQELALVDDQTYADAYVRSRQQNKGRIALRRELFRKGVPEPMVDRALEPLDTPGQVEAALAVLEKQAWRFDSGDRRKDYAKAYAFLARRGFTSEVVRSALEQSPRFGGA